MTNSNIVNLKWTVRIGRGRICKHFRCLIDVLVAVTTITVEDFAGILLQYFGESVNGWAYAGCIDQINQRTILRWKTDAFEPHFGKSSTHPRTNTKTKIEETQIIQDSSTTWAWAHTTYTKLLRFSPSTMTKSTRELFCMMRPLGW